MRCCSLRLRPCLSLTKERIGPIAWPWLKRRSIRAAPGHCSRAGSSLPNEPGRMNKLIEICATKRDEVRARKVQFSLADLAARASGQTAPRSFEAALRTQAQAGAESGFALIDRKSVE